MTTSTTLIPVTFRDATLTLIDHHGEPYVAMRPLVEAMGMAWKPQFDKILKAGSRFSSTVVEITTVAQDGKQRKMICLPLRKLTGWLMTIHPGNVRESLRDRIKAYQAECDDALWAYWTQGHASRPAAPAPALPPPPDTLSRSDRRFINQRAWRFAQDAYESTRERMADMIERAGGIPNPAERMAALARWQPYYYPAERPSAGALAALLTELSAAGHDLAACQADHAALIERADLAGEILHHVARLSNEGLARLTERALTLAAMNPRPFPQPTGEKP